MLPDAGDIAWVEFDPILGTEQAGRRPALVLSSRVYHEVSPRAVVCPITKTEREWPFEVAVPPGYKTRGFVLLDQVRTIDRPQRMFGVVEAVSPIFLTEIRERLAAFLGIPISET
ncbi:MAG: type II toxin-antitoxin system PemK/MazF family toxin [Methyloceanibacter sp.]|uniref:type II toxin-antitoxin system PemK/MazF family toxin n=1 Tax=Methyloceanibacter sp. TaxID=1965321 RepID=UPI003D6CA249